MALKVKAVERLVKFNKEDAGVYRYVMSPELYIALSQAKVIREAALRSGVSQGVMKACWDAAGEVIKAWATEGHLCGAARTGYDALRSARQERGEGGGREGWSHLEPPHHLHPDTGSEGRAGRHRHPDYLLRPQRRHREACHIGRCRYGRGS